MKEFNQKEREVRDDTKMIPVRRPCWPWVMPRRRFDSVTKVDCEGGSTPPGDDYQS